MKKMSIIPILAVLLLTSACEHKELCYNHREHAHNYYVNVIADYRYDWEETYGIDWKTEGAWPDWYMSYDDLRPSKPDGLRVINYSEYANSNIHNIDPDGGVVNLYEGRNDILFYNNDTEYIVFTHNDTDNGATTRVTTRRRTRSTYIEPEYANVGEPTMTPPDILYANFYTQYIPEKVSEPVDLKVTLQPLVFTYKVRYEFAEGLEYVALARGALTGMARSVLMNTGETSADGATILYDCEVVDYGVRAFVTSFGIPNFPNDHYPTRGPAKHALNLELLLRNGSMITLNYDVTDQVQAQPHGGVIVVKDIVVEADAGTQGSGAFDVEVEDWGPYEDIDILL